MPIQLLPLPSVPSPSTWVSGPVSSTQLRADVSNAVAFLSSVPQFIGTQTTSNQALTGGTRAAVSLDSEVWDNYNGHSVVTNTARYTFQVPGWYLVTGGVPIVSGNASTNRAQTEIATVSNGAALAHFTGAEATDSTNQLISTYGAKLVQAVQTPATDYVQLEAFNSANATINNSPPAYLAVRWVAANSGTVSLPVPVNAAWPVPPANVTSAFLNTNIRDTINFLTYPPIMESYRNSATGTLASQAAVPTAGTTIINDTKVIDNYTAYNTTTGVWTAPVAGVYFFYGLVFTGTTANSLVQMAGLTVTSSNYNSGTTITLWGGMGQTIVSSQAGMVVAKRLRLNASDTVSLAGFQNSTSATANTFPGGAEFCCRLISVWERS